MLSLPLKRPSLLLRFVRRGDGTLRDFCRQFGMFQGLESILDSLALITTVKQKTRKDYKHVNESQLSAETGYQSGGYVWTECRKKRSMATVSGGQSLTRSYSWS